MEKGFVNCKVLYNDNKCMFSFIEHHKLRDAEGSTSQALSYLSLLIQKSTREGLFLSPLYS